MTQEEKQLLLKDLCARLPYGVKVNIKSDYTKVMEDTELSLYHLDGFEYNVKYRSLRPYLRSMSSMTEEEKKEWNYLYLPLPHKNEATETERRIDWLNEHHFDYRNLIEKGLALEAPEWMYKQ